MVNGACDVVQDYAERLVGLCGIGCSGGAERCFGEQRMRAEMMFVVSCVVVLAARQCGVRQGDRAAAVASNSNRELRRKGGK